jgi:hypothetical protein
MYQHKKDWLSDIDKMTTRQHLIEQDCMDNLKWSVERVARSSDDEMIQALAHFESSNTAHNRRASTHQNVVPIPTMLPVLNKKCELHLVERLRDAINMKTVCIASNDLMDEDTACLRASLDRDNQSLENALSVLMDQMNCQRIQETKKCKIRTLLHHVVNSVGGVDDVAHLKEVDRQLVEIKENIQGLRKLVGSG